MKAYQFLFGILLLWAVAYTITLRGNVTLETGLADVAPSIANTQQTREAIDALRDNIEKRVILLVAGADEDSVYDATDTVLNRLESVEAVRRLPNNEELFDRLVSTLEPHRFHLLSEQQATILREQTPEQLIKNAKRDLTSVGNAQIYSFAKDPFGTASNSLFDVLQSWQGNSASGHTDHYQSITLMLRGDALDMTQQQQLSHQLNQIIEDVVQEFDVQIDRSGIFFFASHAARESKQDISLISSISTVAVIALLLFVFRSPIALILPMISIGLGVGFAFLVTHLVFGAVHVLTIVFGAGLIGIVIDYSLHYFYHSASTSRDVNQKPTDGEGAALHRALFLSLCTSIIGYAALSFSGLDALKKVAVFSCCGLIMAWLSVVCLGPLATRRGWYTESSGLFRLVWLIQRTVQLIPRAVLLWIGAMMVITAAVIYWDQKPVSDDPRVFFDAPKALLESEQRVAAVSNDFEPGRYVLLVGDSVADLQQRFTEVQDIVTRHTQLPANTFSSVFSLVPNDEKQLTSYQLHSKLYTADGALAQLAEDVGMDPKVVDELQTEFHNAVDLRLTPERIQQALGDALPPMWFTNQSGYVAFVLIRKGIDTEPLTQLLRGLDGVEYVNTLAKTQSALAHQRQSASWLLGLAYLMVAIMLMLRFRSWRAAVMVCVPMISTAMLIALTIPVGYQLNLFHIMSLFLVLGFGMDYTIFVREMAGHSEKTLQAIMLSALTSLLSFGLLALSNIPVVSSFGMALLIGNSFNLLGAFVYSHMLETIHSENT